MSYLGFNVGPIVAGSVATGPAAPFVAAAGLLASALPFLSEIGAGRKDADVITPKQNELGDALGQLDTILHTQQLSVSDLNQLIQQLQALWAQFMRFIYQDALVADGDSRASDQAKATMEPQVRDRLNYMGQMLYAMTGTPNVPTMTQGNGNSLPALQFRTVNTSLPQAGFVQPGSLPPNPTVQTISLGGGSSIDMGLLMKVGLGVGVFLLLRGR